MPEEAHVLRRRGATEETVVPSAVRRSAGTFTGAGGFTPTAPVLQTAEQTRVESLNLKGAVERVEF